MEGGTCLSPPGRGELTGCAPHLSRVSVYWEDGASRRRLWGTWPRVFYPEDPLKPTALTRGLSLHPPDCRMCVPPTSRLWSPFSSAPSSIRMNPEAAPKPNCFPRGSFPSVARPARGTACPRSLLGGLGGLFVTAARSARLRRGKPCPTLGLPASTPRVPG